MAFPYTFEANFELGDASEFDAETDTGSLLDFPSVFDLARIPGLPAPFRGAHCMRLELAGATDAFVQEDDDFDLLASETLHVAFALFLADNLEMANNNVFDIFAMQSAGPVNEATLSIQFTTANGFRIGMGETAGTTQLTPISKGEWHLVETIVHLDAGGGNDGTLDLRLDNGPALTQITGLDQAAIAQARLGAENVDAGTSGTILFDRLIADDGRIGPMRRFPQTVELTKSGHLFVGPGQLENIELVSGAGTDCVLECFDTDEAETFDGIRKARLQNTASNEIIDPAGMPVLFDQGCFVQLSGTNPRAIAKLSNVPAYGGDGAIRTYAARRQRRATP